MEVKLVSCTRWPDYVAADAAAICTDSSNPQKSLSIAMASGHESVLEHASFTFLVSGVSRALLAQLTRHRIASFSVQSQRYVSLRDCFGFVIPPSIEDLGEEAIKEYCQQMETMHKWYCGWCDRLGEDKREDARYVLPNATHTKLMFTMNGRELRHFLELRECNKAQWEIRELAKRVHRLAVEAAPAMFFDAGPGCVRGHCPEKKPCGKRRE